MPVLTPPDAANETLTLDPTSENTANAPLEVTADPYCVVAMGFPTPPIDARYAEPADTHGDPLVALRYRNREIALTVGVAHDTDAGLANAMSDLAAKVAKLNQYGGTLKRVLPDATTIVFDVLQASLSPKTDIAYSAGRYIECDITLTCKPFGRGTETSYSAHTETSKPALVFTETAAPGGDVPALGRLVVTDAQGADQQWMVAGAEVENFDTTDPATKKLFYEAELMTPLNTSLTATSSAGASGGSPNIMVGAITSTEYIALMSTQASGGGAHLAHIGQYRVFARYKHPAEQSMTFALEWAVGDFQSYTRNTPIVSGADESGWHIADLGLIDIPEIQTGTQRWEGRIIGKSTLSSVELHIDCLWLVPVGEFSGEATGTTRAPAAASHHAYDAFNQAAGNATGKTLTVGGTWQGAGSANDFTMDGAGRMQRATGSDASGLAGGRLLTASTPTAATGCIVRLTTATDTDGMSGVLFGVIARYVDSSNFLTLYWDVDTRELRIAKRVAGTDTTIASASASAVVSRIGDVITLTVTASGAVTGTLVTNYGTTVTVAASDSDLATGGTLDNGTVGVIDRCINVTPPTREYSDIVATPYTSDAAVFANQSLQIRHDGVIREDPTGSVYGPVGKYEGDLCFIPPAGAEARGLRCIVKASRGDLDGHADSAIDDITAQLYYTPRYLVVPS